MNDIDAEMLALLKRTHAWIDELLVAGMNEAQVVSAIMGAIVERLLRAGGEEEAARYLQRHADLARAVGPALLNEIVR